MFSANKINAISVLPTYVDIPVKKIWDDKGYEKNRPKEVEVSLYDGDILKQTITLSEDNNWSNKFVLDQNEMRYTSNDGDTLPVETLYVKEKEVNGYVSSGNVKVPVKLTPSDVNFETLDNPITGTYQISSINIAIILNNGKYYCYTTNVVPDENAKNIIREKYPGITFISPFNQSYKGEYTDVVRWNEKTTPITLLNDSQIIALGDVLWNHNVDTISTITIKNTYNITQISGQKIWDDQNNIYNTRPESINVSLMNGNKVIQTKKITAKDNWKYNFEAIKYDNNKNEINYTVKENTINGYNTSYNNYNIINTLEYKSFTVTKKWNDNKKKHKDVTVYLMQDGKIIKNKSIVLNEANNWKVSFTDLPKSITYTIKEENVKGYTSKITGNDIDGFIITNTRIRSKIVKTGVNDNLSIYYLLLVLSLLILFKVRYNIL